MAQEVMLTEEQEARMNQHIKVYFEELGLSEDKKQIFKKITKKYALKMKTLKRDNDSKYAKYRKLKSIKKSKFFSFFLKNIFTPPEKKQFELIDLSNEIYKKEKSLLTWGGHSTFLFQNQNVNFPNHY